MTNTSPINGRDFYLDLPLYHRHLKRLIAVDLKIGEFEAGFKGQMELYLRWLDKHERAPESACSFGPDLQIPASWD